MFLNFSKSVSWVGICGEVNSYQFAKQEVLDTLWNHKKIEQ